MLAKANACGPSSLYYEINNVYICMLSYILIKLVSLDDHKTMHYVNYANDVNI